MRLDVVSTWNALSVNWVIPWSSSRWFQVECTRHHVLDLLDAHCGDEDPSWA